MGDRANIIVKQGNGDAPVVVYSHWGGNALANGKLASAIEVAKVRTGDPHYFTALLVKALDLAELVSGIGTSLDDNNHPIMVVNAETGKREPNISEGAAKAWLNREIDDPIEFGEDE